MSGLRKLSPQVIIDGLLADGDVIAAAFGQLVVSIVEQLGIAGEWNQPRALYSILRENAHVATSNTTVMLQAAPADLPEAFAQMQGPAVAATLAHIAAEMRATSTEQARKAVAGIDVAGLMLIDEAWVVGADAGPDAAEAARRREIHKHPARREARFAVAVDRAGYRYQAAHVRGEADVSFAIDKGDGQHPPIGGSIPDAIAKLCEALP